MRISMTKGETGTIALMISLLLGKTGLAQEITWLTSYAQARQAAQDSNRPLLLNFCQPGCIPCQEMDEKVLRDPVHTGILSREFVCLKIDARHDDYLVKSLKIKVFPTILLASPNGSILHRMEGLDEVRQITVHIDEGLRRYHFQEEASRRNPYPQSPYAPAGQAAPNQYANQSGTGSNGSPRYFTTNYFIPTTRISC
jgi:Thioredoxin-like